MVNVKVLKKVKCIIFSSAGGCWLRDEVHNRLREHIDEEQHAERHIDHCAREQGAAASREARSAILDELVGS